MIEFNQVSRNYGAKLAVDGIDFAVGRGELFAFLGPNGAGKTTTIRMLVGLLRPSAGTIRICGHDTVKAPREACRLMGYVPDEPFLYDKLTGREFLRFLTDAHGLSDSESNARIDREAANFELDPFLDQLTESYSLGMKQRLVFAAALVHNPAVIVLDEPMVGLDPRSARITKDLLRRLANEGATIFMSTHTLAMAEELADRVGIIHAGKLRFIGSLDDLRKQSQSQGASLEGMFLELTATESNNKLSRTGVEH